MVSTRQFDEERVADREQRLDVADVVLERGTRTTTSGTRASSARSSASRIATTEKFAYDSPIVRSTRAVRAGSASAGFAGASRASSASGPASSTNARRRRAPAGSSRLNRAASC